jgi:hypothetical protein
MAFRTCSECENEMELLNIGVCLCVRACQKHVVVDYTWLQNKQFSYVMVCVWRFMKMYQTISQYLRWDTHARTHTHITGTHVRAGTTVSVVPWFMRGKNCFIFFEGSVPLLQHQTNFGHSGKFRIYDNMEGSILIYWNSLGVRRHKCDVLHPKCDRKLIRYSGMRWCVHVCLCACVPVSWLRKQLTILTCFNYQLDAQFLYSVIYVLH